jgi:hypothetical protein
MKVNIIEELQQTVWTLDEGLDLVRRLQPETRQFGYHLTLGGGVLNNGRSKKDLDLFFLPLSDVRASRSDRMLSHLIEKFGHATSLVGYGDDRHPYAHKVRFDFGGKRIDAFIL